MYFSSFPNSDSPHLAIFGTVQGDIFATFWQLQKFNLINLNDVCVPNGRRATDTFMLKFIPVLVFGFSFLNS